MNLNQIKSIDLVSFLKKLGLESKKEQNDQVWYYSPFREESKPSFNIKKSVNKWYDFGLGKGGSIIDFVMILKQLDFKNSIKYIESINKNEIIEKISNPQKEKTIDIEHKLQDLKNPILIKYLESRKLNIDYCKKYLKEIYYKRNDKWYFGICIENGKKGFEIRNEYFKGTLGKKDISIIKGQNNSKLNIFEGFIDFISYLTIQKKSELEETTIILNSVSNINTVVLGEFSEIILFLDNDSTGKNTVLELKNKYNIIDKSIMYKDFKDINEFLLSK